MGNSINETVDYLTKAHLRNVQQLAVFYTGHGGVYAINIAKIKAFIITEEVDITDTPTDNQVIVGTATIRGEPVTIVNLDRWLGKPALDNILDYRLIIFCEFNHHQIGFLVKDVINIVEKTTEELIYSEEQNSKITYTTYVEVNGEQKLCTVFNAEQLLVDIGWSSTGHLQLEKYVDRPVASKKLILVAEDSKVAREVLDKFLIRIEARFEIYNNGSGVINRLKHIDPSEVGLIITDIEMPEVDGYQVAQFVKLNSQYQHIPVVVNSSMTTSAVRGKMEQIGIDQFVGKTDIPALYNAVVRYLGIKSN
jgi:two-component system chemotaxis response regulator CheV